MQIWAESGKSALPICNYSQILYQFLTFTQKLKRSQQELFCFMVFSFPQILSTIKQINDGCMVLCQDLVQVKMRNFSPF